jgi:hypothetical protein
MIIAFFMAIVIDVIPHDSFHAGITLEGPKVLT